ncbi:hypothetical protein Drorol1_Dr00013624 [Drosera rotundifolia]
MKATATKNTTSTQIMGDDNNHHSDNPLTNFTHFYRQWLRRHSDLLHRDTIQLDQDKQQLLVEEILAHYNDYLESKSDLAKHDVFLVISPPWLTPLERSLNWISDPRPSIAFRILSSSIEFDGLAAKQRERIEAVREETARVEKELSDSIARVQETAAGRPMAETAKRAAAAEWPEDDKTAAAEDYRRAMKAVVETADGLRRWAVLKVVEVLGPAHGLRFLCGLVNFQVDVREVGLELETQRARNGGSY